MSTSAMHGGHKNISTIPIKSPFSVYVFKLEYRKRTRRRTEDGKRTRGAQTEDKEDNGRTTSVYKGDSNAASQYGSDGARVNICRKKE